ncbi:uncharacterized protein [Ptychodera flava]|uniref:uncharacterized protein n=1 Tax=Ptychodera flava TaxID=63121 RepID=UPI00396A80B4
MATDVELTEGKIDDIEDLMTAFDLADDLGIDIDDNLQTLDQVKNLLRSHIHNSKDQQTANLNAITLVTKCQQEDDERRKRLQDLYEKVEQHFENFDDYLTAVLQKEDVIGDFSERVVKIVQSLQTGDCPILIAGETSAGKSSLLNLILGEDVLPYSHLSSTSSICILRWGEQRKLRINYMYGKGSDEISVEERGEALLKKLSKYVHQTRDREKGSNYESIELFMPIPLLKNGIFIVDSPGIGENDVMDAIVTGYLNEAFAFVYVINSANAGGVQEDRLQRFLRLVLERKSPDEQLKFNTRAAIFVCNKWDCVPKKESELVKEDTMKKLQRCWPGLTMAQVFFLSTKNASSALKNGSITSDFARLLHGIQHLLPVSLTSKVQVHYSWLDYFVTRVLLHVNTYLNKTKRDSLSLETSYKATEQRLLKLEMEAKSVMINLKSFLEDNVKAAILQLQQVLSSDDVNKQMSDWDDTEHPQGLTWPVIESKIEAAITEKLHKQLCDWEERANFFGLLQPLLLDKFRKEFQTIEGKVAAIETAIERPDIKIDDEEMVTKDIVHDEIHNYKHKLIQINAKKNAADRDSTSSMWLPFNFLSSVFTLPIWLGRKNMKGLYDKRGEHAQMHKYQKNPAKYMKQRALYVLEKFGQEENVRKYVVSQLKPVYHVVSKLEITIPKMIEADRQMMESLKRDTRSVDEIRKLYGPLQQVFDKYYGLLSKYGYEDIREFEIDPTMLKGYSSAPGSQCGFFDYHHMEITRPGDVTPRPVIVKRYLLDLNEDSAFLMRKEEENFRKLRFPNNIPTLLGLTQDPMCSTKKPAFVLENCRYSLRKLQKGEINKRPASFYKPIAVQSVVSYVMDITSGLDFLHKKGLVHIELSLDTLMVNCMGKVMLTNIGLPREVRAAPNNTTKWFVYLSPEVLQGAVYHTTSDIYSLGLVMWELWYGDKITKNYKDEHLASMEVFASHVKTPNMDGDKPMHSGWCELMESCWADSHLRPSANGVFKKVKTIKWDEDQ